MWWICLPRFDLIRARKAAEDDEHRKGFVLSWFWLLPSISYVVLAEEEVKDSLCF
jgi:hypothetical protein